MKIKHATGQLCANTTIVREYPDDFGPGKEAYYPIPAPETAALYQKYKQQADAEPAVSFIGRLATYRYYNMDQVVGMALAEVERLEQNRMFPDLQSKVGPGGPAPPTSPPRVNRH
jgi:UDP-galactopyranose mutase